MVVVERKKNPSIYAFSSIASTIFEFFGLCFEERKKEKNRKERRWREQEMKGEEGDEKCIGNFEF